ncbi:putative aliphatic sulfonates transport permease protein SsuC [compost metagenome]
MAFFIGHPLDVLQRVWAGFSSGEGTLPLEWRGRPLANLTFPGTVYPHLIVTLVETLLAFVLGLLSGLGTGLWLALSPRLSQVLSPFIKAANAIPRVVLAPLFVMWFGLGMSSKVALAVTLVFFVVFFNVYQGVREVNPALLANVRLLGASRTQLIRTVYLPAAMTWMFSSLHTVVGLAFVGAVVGEYLGASRGIGYLILQAEASFDVNGIMAGIVVLTACALALDALVGVVERRLLRWQP